MLQNRLHRLGMEEHVPPLSITMLCVDADGSMAIDGHHIRHKMERTILRNNQIEHIIDMQHRVVPVRERDIFTPKDFAIGRKKPSTRYHIFDCQL